MKKIIILCIAFLCLSLKNDINFNHIERRLLYGDKIKYWDKEEKNIFGGLCIRSNGTLQAYAYSLRDSILIRRRTTWAGEDEDKSYNYDSVDWQLSNDTLYMFNRNDIFKVLLLTEDTLKLIFVSGDYSISVYLKSEDQLSPIVDYKKLYPSSSAEGVK